MGYAQTIPFSFINSIPVAEDNIVTVTTGNNDYTIGTLKTPNYKMSLAYSYATLYVPYRQNTAGVVNSLSDINGGYLMLNDGASTKDCGNYINSVLFTGANSYAGSWLIHFSNDLSSYLKPNTTYTATLKATTAVADNLVLYSPYTELFLYFSL